MAGGLYPHHAFALGVRLQAKPPEGELEPGEVVAWGLDHGREGGGLFAVTVGPAFGPEAEPVKLFETNVQEIFGARSAGWGLLIHAAPGSSGGVGALFTNRSGWAA